MTDVLADIGLCSHEWVEQQIDSWRSLFATYRPKLIVTDYAPGAVLAARGIIPCLATGNGYTVPPGGLRPFPRFHDMQEQTFAEGDVLGAVNAGLAAFRGPPIRALSDALSGDERGVCTLPLIDPYSEHRKEPVLGPLLLESVSPQTARADEIFCYLREAPLQDRLDDLASALVNLPFKVVAFLPGISSSREEWLKRHGAIILKTLVSLNAQLSKTRLLVHSGGHGMASAAVLAGVPQLVVSFDVEKWLTAARLVSRGLAHQLDYLQADAGALREAILSALGDRDMEERSRQASVEHEAYRGRDVARDIADRCQRTAA